MLKILFRNIRHSKHLYISFLILFIAFAFSRLPFFIWMPIPIINSDTFDYYAVVRELLNGTFKEFGILPPGLILFLYVMELLFTKTFFIFIVQNIISLLACIFVVSATAKTYKKFTIPVAVALAVYIMDSYCLRYDFALLTESLYRNSLIIIAGLLFLVINSKKKTNWLLFSVCLIFPPLFRSNGLYIYFLPFLLLFFLALNKFSLKYYLLLFLPILILNLSWSAFNYSTEKRFFPGNPGRLNSIVHSIYASSPDSTHKDTIADEDKTKAALFMALSTYIAEGRPQFYYTFLAEAYRDFYTLDLIHDTAYKRTDWTVPVDTSLKKLALKEFYTKPNKYTGVIDDFHIATAHNLWLNAYHIYYKIHTFLFNNYLILISFIIVFCIAIWQSFKSRFKNKAAFLLVSLGSIHVMAILSLTFFGWYQGRYVQVSEFIVYLTLVLSPNLFIKKKETDNH